MPLSANAQGTCRLTEDFGALRSHQTITRIGLLNSSSCRFDGVRYYASYDFQLSGAGEIRLRLNSSDFSERIALNTDSREFLASADARAGWGVELVRTLPAGRYRMLAVSNQNERAGSYTLTIRTGQLAPPPSLPPIPGLRIALGVEGNPDGTAIVSDGTLFAVTAALVYEGANQGPHSVSDITLRIAGPYEWEFWSERNSGRTAKVPGQLAHCAAAGGQVRCPLDLTANGQKAAITIPIGTPAGLFTISASASVRGATVGDSLAVTVAPTPPVGVGETTESNASAETVSGRVIARVLPLPDGHRGGRYRIEFGFLSAEVLASGTDRSAVVDANPHLLPSARYLTEAELLARSQADNRRWLRSSPIEVLPLEDDDAGLSGEPLLTGRVIARWNPTRGGTFRVEFGFLPDSAFAAAGDDTQRAAELYAELLPESRYLTQSTIDRELRRDQPRWLASSELVLASE